jgi:C1A family cysteine protease
MDNAFSWINKNEGVCSDKEYPYISGTTKTNQLCNSCKNEMNTFVQKFTDVKQNSDDAMMSALSSQPVSVAIEADKREFQLYKSGIFSSSCGTNLDHGVGLVGYGKDYYILRNSWGPSWGDNGYMLIGKGFDPLTEKPYNNGNGQCGVLLQGSYPSV